LRHSVFLVSLSLHQTGVTKEQKEYITIGCIGTSVPLRGRGTGDRGRPVVLIDKGEIDENKSGFVDGP
jgi:hypothetical protein